MKSSLRSDEIFNLRHQLKLNPPTPALAGFHREVISSTIGGFIPQKADLVEKSEACISSATCCAMESDQRSGWNHGNTVYGIKLQGNKLGYALRAMPCATPSQFHTTRERVDAMPSLRFG